MTRRKKQPVARNGMAAVELAVVAPLLLFLFAIAVDFARVSYFSQTIENCARNGAVYGSNLTTATSPYPDVKTAALADASNLSPAPTVSSATGTDASGNPYVAVTVNWQFRTVLAVPGVSQQVNLSRTVQMRVAPN